MPGDHHPVQTNMCTLACPKGPVYKAAYCMELLNLRTRSMQRTINTSDSLCWVCGVIENPTIATIFHTILKYKQVRCACQGHFTRIILLNFQHRRDKKLLVELSWIILPKVFTRIIVFVIVHRAWIRHAHWYTKSSPCMFLNLSHLLY